MSVWKFDQEYDPGKVIPRRTRRRTDSSLNIWREQLLFKMVYFKLGNKLYSQNYTGFSLTSKVVSAEWLLPKLGVAVDWQEVDFAPEIRGRALAPRSRKEKLCLEPAIPIQRYLISCFDFLQVLYVGARCCSAKHVELQMRMWRLCPCHPVLSLDTKPAVQMGFVRVSTSTDG